LSFAQNSFFYNQVTLGAGETLVSKQTFESILKSFGFAVSNHHGHNDVFKTQTFMDDCNRKLQQITFSCTDAHHQNGVAEHSIQTVVGRVRTLLLHAAIHCPEMADIKLWPFDLQHAVHLWNIRPDQCTPLKIIAALTCSKLYPSSTITCLRMSDLFIGSKNTRWKEGS